MKTNASYLVLGWIPLLTAAALMLCNIFLSWVMRLGLARRFVLASSRMVIQLLLMGLILEWLFTLKRPLWVLLIGLSMTTIASITAVQQTKRRFAHIYWNSFVSIFSAALLVTSFALLGVIQVTPWYEPQYFIPLLGMVLGNALNGISLALDRFTENIAQGKERIETFLALGASRWEAAHEDLKDAMRVGMLPLLNTMMVMGLVSMPGMMTGQILAGARPSDAVRYQIVIVFMIASATALAAFGSVLLAFFALFNHRHQLLSERLIDVSKKGTPSPTSK